MLSLGTVRMTLVLPQGDDEMVLVDFPGEALTFLRSNGGDSGEKWQAGGEEGRGNGAGM